MKRERGRNRERVVKEQEAGTQLEIEKQCSIYRNGQIFQYV